MFMDYRQAFDSSIDRIKYKEGWLFNGRGYLNRNIDEGHIREIERCWNGMLDVEVDDRHLLVKLGRRFHYVLERTITTGRFAGRTCFRCNCKEYYNPKLCAFAKKDKICLKKKTKSKPKAEPAEEPKEAPEKK